MNLKRVKNIFTRHLPTLVRVELAKRFPSSYAAVKIRPSSAWINVTDNCNMRCIMCNQWETQKSGEMTTDEWKRTIDQLADIGVREVAFGGGEPLLVRDLPDLIRHARGRGMAAGITTSGYLLNERKMDELLDAGISNVTISIDGVGEDYERIRRREWKNVLHGAELLARAQAEGKLSVIMGFVLMKPTIQNYPAVQELAKRLKFPLVVSLVDTTPFLFQLPENANENWIGPSAQPQLGEVQRAMVGLKASDAGALYNSFADIDFFEAYFKEPLQKDIPCTVSQVRIMINGMGEVYGGCWSMGHFGSLREKTLKEIITSDKYVKTHEAMFYKKCPGCSCGYTVSNRYDFPSQLKEVGYRLIPGLRRKIGAKGPVVPVAPARPQPAEKTPVDVAGPR